MKKDELRKYIVLGILFICSIVAQHLYLYGFQNSTIEEITVEYYNPEDNEIVHYNYQFEIVKPFQPNLEKLPTVILLHGDNTDSRSMNTIKLEFLHNNYIVVLLNIQFSYLGFFELNSTLNYLLTKEDINASQIGIIGHSHGAHYAFLFAWMRNDSIRSVICTNFGPFGGIYLDYFEFFHQVLDINKTWDFSTFLSNYTILVYDNKPKNMLLLTNIYNSQRKTSEYNYEGNLTLWEFDQQNQFFGSFQNETARELYINPSIFFHGSGLYDPFDVQKQIKWMNQALEHTNELNNFWFIGLRISIFLGFIILISVFGLILLGKILSLLPFQFEVLKRFVEKIKRKDNKLTEIKLKDEFNSDNRQNENFSEVVIQSYGDFKKVFYYIILFIIGGNLFLYFIDFFRTHNVMYFNISEAVDNFTDIIFVFNEIVGFIIYFGPISFGIMYIWTLIIIFIDKSTIEEPIPSEREEYSKLSTIQIFIIIFEFICLIWVFIYFLLYNWSGYDLTQSLLNVVLRFSIIFCLNFLAFKYYHYNLKEDLSKVIIYSKTVVLLAVLYLPFVAMPELSFLYFFFEYYWFYFIPFIFQVLILPLLFFKNFNLYSLTFINFYILLLWQITIFF